MSEAAPELGVVPQTTRRDHVSLGIVYMIASTVVFSVSSAMSKWLVATYPPGEVLFTRALGSLLICSIVILPGTGLAVFRTQRLGHHVLRTLTQSVSQTFLVIAFSLMPLATATAINFSAPLFTSLLSMLLLKEVVSPARWSVLLVGFLGVLIVTNPGAETFQVGALFALANAIMYGSVTAAVRGMTKTESAATLTLYQLTLITGFFACLLPFGASMPSSADAVLMLINGLTNGVG
jgi:drug/metabolite transporter (DMT)-like permease